MKKYLLIFAAITVMAASCQKEDNLSKDGKVTVSLSANVDNNQTKVNYVKDASVYKGSWATGDAVSIIAPNNTNAAFSYKSGNEFTGEVTPWTEASDVYGVYPYSSTAYTITDGKLKDFDASSLTITAGGTNCTACLMVAKSNGVSAQMPGMSFKQAMAIVRMNITNVPSGVTVTKAAVINQDMYSNLTLVGKADIDMSTGAIDGTPTYTNKIVADITGAPAGNATSVNVPLFPTTTAAKYSFCVTLSNGKVYKKTLSDAKTFAQNTIYTLEYNLSIEQEEDILVIVNYKLDNTALDLSGYDRSMVGSPVAQINDKLGIIVSSTPYHEIPPTYKGYVYCENLYDEMKDGFTIELWAYAKSLPPTDWSFKEYKIVSSTKSAGYTLYIKNGSYGISVNENGVWKENISDVSEITNCWKHVFAVWDKTNSKSRIYIDNSTQYKELDGITDMKITSYELPNTGFGANASVTNAQNSLDGFLGPSRIWNRVLSQTEIANIYTISPTNPATPF